MNQNEIIDQLGGTAEVARLCHVKPPSVSQWRESGIPAARLMFLRLLRPDVFAAVDAEKSPISEPEDAREPGQDRRTDREPPHVMPEHRFGQPRRHEPQ